jgi:hypothetical protein
VLWEHGGRCSQDGAKEALGLGLWGTRVCGCEDIAGCLGSFGRNENSQDPWDQLEV